MSKKFTPAFPSPTKKQEEKYIEKMLELYALADKLTCEDLPKRRGTK